MSLTTHSHPHPHPQPRQHTTHRTGPPRRKSGLNLHRTSSHGGIHATASALALTTNQNQSQVVPRMERQDSGASKASDEVSVTSAPGTGAAAGRTRGKHVHGMHHVARPGGVGPRRKSQVHIGDHARRGSRNSRSDTNLSRLGLTSLARANSRTHLAKGEPEPEVEAEAEEEEWEEAPGVEARGAGSSDDNDEDDDEEEDGDELIIPIKKKPTPRAKDLPSKGFAPAVVASPEQHVIQRTTPAPRTETLAPAPAPPTPRQPSPAPSDAGTLIATPTKSHTAPAPSGRHIRTRNSHTSLQSLTAGSLRSFLTGPHHPLSSPKPGKRREGTAPPVVSGETARGAWAGPAVEGMPTPTRTTAERPPAAAASSLRKASFTGSPSGGDVSGLPPPGRLSAHSVAQRAALLPTMSSRPSSAGAADATRQQMERESVNLVSRFVTLPSSTSAQGTQGIFPESPFAGAHASLVRTLMEEGAQLLPLDNPTNPSLRRTETSRAATPKPPRATGGAAPPYGAGQAPQGMEWVAGLTPFEMSVQRCLAQRKGAVRLATGRALGPLGA
ncbi:hypothetical protein NliqN6_6518 [Naganishia liquefaciens]|uniref:Uncharacterized protein n=1 Tax=Naganishia liquefaciens TaxID=104408 RepID=A0A8H3YK22_9TREE|nr:hypothetical protein NliqN6_6518 [Naganishia liquefaciens]